MRFRNEPGSNTVFKTQIIHRNTRNCYNLHVTVETFSTVDARSGGSRGEGRRPATVARKRPLHE